MRSNPPRLVVCAMGSSVALLPGACDAMINLARAIARASGTRSELCGLGVNSLSELCALRPLPSTFCAKSRIAAELCGRGTFDSLGDKIIR